MSEYYDGFWHIPANVDISNLATATIEVIIAVILGSIAIGIAVVFYYKERDDTQIIKDYVNNQDKNRKNRLMVHAPKIRKILLDIKRSYEDQKKILDHKNRGKIILEIHRYINEGNHTSPSGIVHYELGPYNFSITIITRQTEKYLKELIEPIKLDLNSVVIENMKSHAYFAFENLSLMKSYLDDSESILQTFSEGYLLRQQNDLINLINFYDQSYNTRP
jgi:hypothetical protein